MNSYQCYMAFISLKKMMNITNIPFKARLQVANLKKALEPIAIAYEQSEHDIINRYADKGTDNNPVVLDGVVRVSDRNRLIAANVEIKALKSEPIDIIFEPIVMEVSKCDEIDITPQDIENLGEFARFS